MSESRKKEQFRLTADPPCLDEQYFTYQPDFIPSGESDRLLDVLWRKAQWREYQLRLFGRHVAQPRLTAWYGDPDARYRYSGLQLEPLPWLPELQRLREDLEAYIQEPLNGVLANAYRDGADSMGWHCDNEPELGDSPIVVSISLGAERRFLVRPRKQRRSVGIWLESGSLLIMKRGCQQTYLHALPKTRVVNDLRINLTFRNIVRQVQH